MNKKPDITPKSINSDVSVLENQALSKLNAGQYKEAIELYKTLLKRENNADWREALSQCYLHRALAFAAKGMVKEALVLWENYAQNAKAPNQARDHYITWLLQTNDMAKVKTCLGQLSAQQLDEHYSDLANLLGLLIITGKVSCQDVLPKDSVFITHLGIVQEALSAYRNNKLEDIESALKKLPFRSAFRDFRTLMKAALLIPESVEQAQWLLAKITAGSPYQQADALLLAITHKSAALVNDLLQLTAPQIKIVQIAKNLNKKQSELLDLLIKQKNRLSDKVKFNVAIQYQELFGVNLAQHYCCAALSNYPAGQRDFTKHFGAINDFEAWRLKALVCERDRDFNGAEYYWQQGINALKKRGDESAFKIALIMRHIAAHQQTPEEAITWLIDSLDNDPDDRETYVKILTYYERQEQETDAFKEWLDKSIKKYPNDVEMLGLAIKAATRNKAFKKATQYATALLKIDPVNTFAKQVLFTSHLAHARKLIKSKKFHLVEKEIQQAEQISIGKRYQTQAQLMRGFFIYVGEDKKRGEQLITETLQKINDGVFNTHFYVFMEALLLNLPIAPLQKLLPPMAKDYVLSPQEIVQLTQQIQQYADDDSANQTHLHNALEKVKAIIKQSVKQIIREETLLTLCQCLDRINHFELLRACVKIALSQWDKPIWMFYRVYSEANGNPAKCSDINSYRLQESLKIAQEQKDQRTTALIGKFLDQYYKSRQSSVFNIFDSLFGGNDDDEDDDPIDELFGHLPDDLFDQLEKKTVVMTNKIPPEKMLKLLAADYFSNNVNKMYDLINDDPEAFFAFLMLKAADDLGIDIGVTAEKIVNCFTGQKSPSKPKPFPFF